METKIELSVYGTRGSCATGNREYMEFGGDTSSYTLRHNDTLHFLDAGSGIRRAMAKELNQEIKNANIYLTHGHADHIDMGCAGSIYFNNLLGKIRLLGYKPITEALNHFFDGKYTWPVSLENIKGLNPEIVGVEGGESFVHQTYKLSTLKNYHPFDSKNPEKNYGGSVGFRWDIKKESGDLVSIAYVTDMEFDYMAGGKVQPKADELKKEFVNFVKDVDVLVADTQFTEQEYNITRKMVRGFGHSYLEQIIDLSNQAGVKTLLGAHHDPTHTDEILRGLERHGQDYARTNGFRGNFAYARDGDKISL